MPRAQHRGPRQVLEAGAAGLLGLRTEDERSLREPCSELGLRGEETQTLVATPLKSAEGTSSHGPACGSLPLSSPPVRPPRFCFRCTPAKKAFALPLHTQRLSKSGSTPSRTPCSLLPGGPRCWIADHSGRQRVAGGAGDTVCTPRGGSAAPSVQRLAEGLAGAGGEPPRAVLRGQELWLRASPGLPARAVWLWAGHLLSLGPSFMSHDNDRTDVAITTRRPRASRAH